MSHPLQELSETYHTYESGDIFPVKTQTLVPIHAKNCHNFLTWPWNVLIYFIFLSTSTHLTSTLTHWSLTTEWLQICRQHLQIHFVEWILCTNIPIQLSLKFVPTGSNDNKCLKVSNISRTLVGNKIVDHSDVVGASPVGAAPTTSSFINLAPGFNGLGKDDSKTRRDTFMFWDRVRLILENWQ